MCGRCVCSFFCGTKNFEVLPGKDVIGNGARRSFAKAVERRAELEAAWAGYEGSEAVATQLFMKNRRVRKLPKATPCVRMEEGN